MSCETVIDSGEIDKQKILDNSSGNKANEDDNLNGEINQEEDEEFVRILI